MPHIFQIQLRFVPKIETPIYNWTWNPEIIVYIMPVISWHFFYGESGVVGAVY